MSLTINNKSIERVMVVDNQPDSLDAIAYSIEEASLEPIVYQKPFTSIEECLSKVTTQAEAAIFAHHLGPQNTIHFSGASAVAHLYQQQFPSLLVTAWAEADIDTIRPFRKNIPILLKSDEADPQLILSGFEQCVKEFFGDYSSSRRKWRTLIRIEDVDLEKLIAYVVIPGWNPNKVVRLPLIMFPEAQREKVIPNARFFAKVNTGALHHEELYFEEFEVAEKPQGKYAELLLS